jgi:hypothetical protein
MSPLRTPIRHRFTFSWVCVMHAHSREKKAPSKLDVSLLDPTPWLKGRGYASLQQLHAYVERLRRHSFSPTRKAAAGAKSENSPAPSDRAWRTLPARPHRRGAPPIRISRRRPAALEASRHRLLGELRLPSGFLEPFHPRRRTWTRMWFRMRYTIRRLPYPARVQAQVERLVGPADERRSGGDRRQFKRVARGRRESDYPAEFRGDRTS